MTINNEYCWMHKPDGWTCPECAQEDHQPAPALQPGHQIEWDAATFGYPANGVMMTRSTAQKFADELVGHVMSDLTDKLEIIACRVISTRLEDDTADGSKGRVIAVCEPVDRKI